MKTRKNGFTLVELLVSITILSILTAVSVVIFTGVTSQARDGQRKRDLQFIKQALELYRSDQGFYPYRINHNYCFTTETGFFVITGTLSLTNQMGIAHPPSIIKTYLDEFPTDPKDNCTDNKRVYFYVPSPSGCANDNTGIYCTTYCLYAQMENTANNLDSPPCLNPSGLLNTDLYNYVISSP